MSADPDYRICQCRINRILLYNHKSKDVENDAKIGNIFTCIKYHRVAQQCEDFVFARVQQVPNHNSDLSH